MKRNSLRMISVLCAGLMLLSVLVLPAAADDAPALPDAAITEVCFNTTYKSNDFDLSTSTDMLEFMEVVNLSGHDLDLHGWKVTYRTEGWDSEIKGTNEVVQRLSEGGYILKAGEAAVFAVYTKDAVTAGLRYDTPEDFKAVYDLFLSINGSRATLPIENFYLIPKAVSGEQKNLSGTFNLDNSSTGVVLTVLDKDGGTVCECLYNAEERNRNNYSLNLMYTGTVKGHPKATEPFNIANPTPGRLFDNQIVPLAKGLTPPEGTATIPLKFMEYNVCATDSTQTHSDTRAVSMAERAEGIFTAIKSHDPDVLCLCEINFTWVDYLNEALDGESGEYASYGKSSQGATWGAKRINKSTWDLFNLILWKKDKYDLIESGTFWCSKTPDKKGTFNWEDGTVGDFARGINWVILEEKVTGARFFVLCQHIDAKVPVARQYSARLIAQKAEELSQGLPVLMTGDWNTGDSSDAYAELMKSGKFGDARYRTTSPENMTLFGTGNSWGSRSIEYMIAMAPIDHCILSKDTVFVRRADAEYCIFDEADHLVGSDHNATVYELDLTVMSFREEETEAPTEPETIPDTEPVTAPAGTDAPSAPVTEADTDPSDDKGCASVTASAGLTAVLIAAAFVFRRRT
ncbi:MAG: endonuclease/exonuclease/phosphatase family protein [Clostridia bacterium]|nr:endonuclease/exonuclease/phosphatase family protein [Clostridia bacterium]